MTPPDFHPSRGRSRFGILVPFTNTNLEPDMTMLWPEGVSLHCARVGDYDQEEIPDAAQMHGLGAAELAEPLWLLHGVQPDVILYGCTSATLTHGPAFDRELADRIRTSSRAQTVTAAGALVLALCSLGATRIVLASPYVADINDLAIRFLTAIGIPTVSRSEVAGQLDKYGQGAPTPQAVFDLGLAADCPEAEVLVLSCTDMRSVEIIDRPEKTVGKPVVASNQAMAFQAMQMAGITAPPSGFGRLMLNLQR